MNIPNFQNFVYQNRGSIIVNITVKNAQKNRMADFIIAGIKTALNKSIYAATVPVNMFKSRMTTTFWPITIRRIKEYSLEAGA
jgi:hypothetical protein